MTLNVQLDLIAAHLARASLRVTRPVELARIALPDKSAPQLVPVFRKGRLCASLMSTATSASFVVLLEFVFPERIVAALMRIVAEASFAALQANVFLRVKTLAKLIETAAPTVNAAQLALASLQTLPFARLMPTATSGSFVVRLEFVSKGITAATLMMTVDKALSVALPRSVSLEVKTPAVLTWTAAMVSAARLPIAMLASSVAPTGVCIPGTNNCTGDRDCGEGFVCGPLKTCVPRGNDSCKTNQDCGVGRVCTSSGICVLDNSPVCSSNVNCGPGLVCGPLGIAFLVAIHATSTSIARQDSFAVPRRFVSLEVKILASPTRSAEPAVLAAQQVSASPPVLLIVVPTQTVPLDSMGSDMAVIKGAAAIVIWDTRTKRSADESRGTVCVGTTIRRTGGDADTCWAARTAGSALLVGLASILTSRDTNLRGPQMNPVSQSMLRLHVLLPGTQVPSGPQTRPGPQLTFEEQTGELSRTQMPLEVQTRPTPQS
ncbi:unnamed protein product [Clonostachys rosea f. rosea IK726]|uniref:Uncharacterized protein n=1 Tax=Clonostachys rosea f. rosea IK726 TaxID=1349383 RepID=A0ACA9UAC1_BIOOC|nr:unnamed protein product [Clonostachys rosea f. rosea IK726]